MQVNRRLLYRYLRNENLDNETTLNFQVSSLSCFVYEKPNIKSKVMTQLFSVLRSLY